MAAREIPYRDGRLQKAGAAFTAAIVFACFTLASTSYLAWLYRLLEYAPGVSAEGVTMVGGYSLQAVGIAFMCALIRRWPEAGGRLPFVTSIALHFACASAAMLASTPASLVALGFAMNFLYGCVCAFYLQRLMHWAPREHRGIAVFKEPQIGAHCRFRSKAFAQHAVGNNRTSVYCKGYRLTHLNVRKHGVSHVGKQAVVIWRYGGIYICVALCAIAVCR